MIRIGIIGMGIRGKLFAETIGQNDHAKVVAVADPNAATLREAEDAFGAKGYERYQDMIDDSRLDAVIVATPDFLHREPVLYAAGRGLHILVEKPFSTSVDDCREMAEAIRRHGVKCLVAFENRWNIPIAAVMDQVRRKRIGEVYTVNARLNDTIFVPTKLLPWAKDSTVGWFLFPHIADLVCLFKGEGKKVTSVYAVGAKKKLAAMGFDTYDTIQAVLNFSDGTHSTLSSSWILPDKMPMIYDFKMEIIGDAGAIYVDTQDQMVRMAVPDQYQHLHTLGTPVNGKLTAGPAFMLHSFIDDLRFDRKPVTTEQDGLINTLIVAAIHESVATGNVVQVSY
ncbi:MAG: Gfo/Idh/MocA family oxidoreductase [Clostridiales bacterium]|nr:Gfo/Idh/MocA family oxidoreductase [Clostridiales bacterium]